jgi:hypothetical protein
MESSGFAIAFRRICLKLKNSTFGTLLDKKVSSEFDFTIALCASNLNFFLCFPYYLFLLTMWIKQAVAATLVVFVVALVFFLFVSFV